MFRLFDWQCAICAQVHEDLVGVEDGNPIPTHMIMQCPRCKGWVEHRRMFPLVAPYMGEKYFAPVVHGGKNDTAGSKALPRLPELPEGIRYKDMKDFFNTREYKQAKIERNRIQLQNKAKKKRLAALKRGENVNFRRDKLPGDPKNIDK